MSTPSAEQWQEISPYLDEALSLTETERAIWLSGLRESKPELAAMLVSLLEEHRVLAHEQFLERSQASVPMPSSLVGQNVGAYKLISPIGQGGMGTVWLAERSDGRFERRAAIKFLNVGLSGGVERFKREGSILGRLTHPHIADLIDAGVTTSGQPYLVLEHIQGQQIDAYCDHHRLDVEGRIGLFLDVLSAVAHAHANLIVHRDIKPSNVLVTSDGQVKLLDFGIAKLLGDGSNSDQRTALTIEGGAALTPYFAAPEQITNGLITTATDVYALGVLLYVLLAGRHPAGQGPHSTADLVHAIVDDEPMRPSAAAATAELNSVAQNRACTPDKLRRQLRGDLDTIICKALKKNAEERYASVQAMADDLERYLKHQPISARRDTLAYRAAKFVRRNRTAAVLSGLAVLAIIGGITGTAMQARTARRQRDLAVRERDRANRVADFMTTMFKVSDPSEAAGNRVSAREILDKASKDIGAGLAHDPILQAQMMDTMGNAYLNLGLYDQARSLLERAIAVSRAAGGPDEPEALRSTNAMAGLLAQQGRYTEAEKLQRETLEAQRRVLGPEHLDTLMTMGDLSGTIALEGHFEEAEKLGREVLEKERRVLGPENRHTMIAMDTLAAILGSEGKLAESEQLGAETIDLERRVYGPDYLDVLNTMGNQADTLYLMGKFEEAKQMLEQTLEIQLRVLGPNHPETARSTYNLGCVAARQGKGSDEVFSLLGRAIDHLSPRTVPKIENDPAFARFRGTPAFANLVARAQLRKPAEATCPL